MFLWPELTARDYVDIIQVCDTIMDVPVNYTTTNYILQLNSNQLIAMMMETVVGWQFLHQLKIPITVCDIPSHCFLQTDNRVLGNKL